MFSGSKRSYITDTFWANFAENHPKLQNLFITHTDITDSQLNSLSKLKYIRHVRLDWTGQGVDYKQSTLDRLEKCPNIRTIIGVPTVPRLAPVGVRRQQHSDLIGWSAGNHVDTSIHSTGSTAAPRFERLITGSIGHIDTHPCAEHL
ncbi:unnamed protein product [Oppiella nova]|uniref:Uncharacterized protein n=1 Tax=Oppiella nova TaxID=334625 RepID=A0A7R9MK14_9ACAR|nr:unnamed protein product [Oppiella nova]CAG2178684.1 unnamed protein product [Oppiella nova]